MMKQSLLKDIQRTDFALKEVTLFLDTHPHCRKALDYYHDMKRRSKMLTEEYERQFGPLTPMGNVSDNWWNWVKSPWPWQTDMGFNCAEEEDK